MSLHARCACIGDHVEIWQVRPICHSQIITEVLYADYVVWGGGMGRVVDNFFNGGMGSPNGKRQIFWTEIKQGNVTYRKNVAPRLVPVKQSQQSVTPSNLTK